MSLEVWDRPEAAEQPSAPAASVQRSRRRRLLVIGAAVLALLLLVLGALAMRGRGGNSEPLDPDNPGPDGAQAIARVLESRGVTVDIARSESDLLGLAAPGGDTTVLVTSTDRLSAQTADTVWERSSGARRVVLVEPGGFILQSLDLGVDPSDGTAPTRSVRAGCTIDGVAPTDTISTLGGTYTSSSPGASACFTFEGSASLVRLAPGTGGRGSAGSPETVVLGAGDILSNGEITRHDNAGVAVRLLGQGERLVWYIPSYLDVTPQDTTPTSEVPRALAPLVFLALFALLATMLWRGRRFGPLVSEPLPAVVKAIETTQSRGRLYRRAGDAGRAGTILRVATVRRLATFLGLPAGSHAGVVAEAVARATGRPPAHVHTLLGGPPPRDEREMIALANDLSTLEKEVHRP